MSEAMNTSQETLRGSLSDVRTKGRGKGRVEQNGDLERLLNPSPLLRKFEPTPDKMKAVARHLMDNELSMSDEYRDYDIIYGILNKYLGGGNSIFYEIGDMDGVFGFTDIIPGWKAHAIFELINPKIWSKQLVRESRALFDLIMKTGDLIKISSQTADKRIAKMAGMIGFVLEGIRRVEFSWDNKPYDIYMIGRFRGNEKEEA